MGSRRREEGEKIEEEKRRITCRRVCNSSTRMVSQITHSNFIACVVFIDLLY